MRAADKLGIRKLLRHASADTPPIRLRREREQHPPLTRLALAYELRRMLDVRWGLRAAVDTRNAS